MSDRDHLGQVTEIDLLAYADGLLDGEPERRAMVEAYLEAYPEDAARVRDYVAQNEEIRSLYASSLDRPVPAHLQALVTRPRPRTTQTRLARAAAVAGLMAMSGAAGWGVGQGTGDEFAWATESFVQQIGERYVYSTSHQSTPETAGSTFLPAIAQAGPVNGIQGVPDLGSLGLELVDHQPLDTDGLPTLRLTYRDGTDGRRVDLFLSRQSGDDPEAGIQLSKTGGVTVAYWMEGPTLYGLVGQFDETELPTLARSIRRSFDPTTMEAEVSPQSDDMAATGGPPVRADVASGPIMPDLALDERAIPAAAQAN